MRAWCLTFFHDQSAPARFIVCRNFDELLIIVFRFGVCIPLRHRKFVTLKAWWFYA